MLKIWFSVTVMLIGIITGCVEVRMEAEQNVTVNLTPVNVTPDPDRYTVFVSIKGLEFDPHVLNVVNGTTVRWTNKDSASHSINVDGVVSPVLNRRDTWNYTFNKTGTFEYNCSIYPLMPVGQIIVN